MSCQSSYHLRLSSLLCDTAQLRYEFRRSAVPHIACCPQGRVQTGVRPTQTSLYTSVQADTPHSSRVPPPQVAAYTGRIAVARCHTPRRDSSHGPIAFPYRLRNTGCRATSISGIAAPAHPRTGARSSKTISSPELQHSVRTMPYILILKNTFSRYCIQSQFL